MALGGIGAELARTKERLRETTTRACNTKDVWTDEYVEQYQRSVLEINLEKWIHIPEIRTFATHCVPLTLADAAAFVASYETFHPEQANHGSAALPPAAQEAVADAVPDVESGAFRVRLEEKVEEGMEALGGAVFLKTSSRSPKDAAISDGALEAAYAARLGDDESLNAKINALLQAGLDVLKVEDAQSGADLLLRSERIYQDMLMAIKYPDVFEESIVAREWVDLDTGLEFRGFVKDGVLTALSQYNALSSFQQVIDAAAVIPKTIDSFFTSRGIGQALVEAGMGDVVIDFGLVPRSDPDAESGFDVWVIELNPFLETTDPALFHWEHDAMDIGNSRKPGPLPVFRYYSSPPSGAKANLSPEWRRIIDV